MPGGEVSLCAAAFAYRSNHSALLWSVLAPGVWNWQVGGNCEVIVLTFHSGQQIEKNQLKGE